MPKVPWRDYRSNRAFYTAILVTTLPLIPGAFFFTDADIAWRVDRAVEQHTPVSDLGTPVMICTDAATCFRNWTCPEKIRIFDKLKEGEQVSVYGRSMATYFFVHSDREGRVQSFARCGS